MGAYLRVPASRRAGFPTSSVAGPPRWVRDVIPVAHYRRSLVIVNRGVGHCEGTDVNATPLLRASAIAGAIALCAVAPAATARTPTAPRPILHNKLGRESTTSTAKPLPGAAPIITESANNSTQMLAYSASSSQQGALRISLQTAGGSGYTWKITKQPDPNVVAAEPRRKRQRTRGPRPPTGHRLPDAGNRLDADGCRPGYDVDRVGPHRALRRRSRPDVQDHHRRPIGFADALTLQITPGRCVQQERVSITVPRNVCEPDEVTISASGHPAEAVIPGTWSHQPTTGVPPCDFTRAVAYLLPGSGPRQR